MNYGKVSTISQINSLRNEYKKVESKIKEQLTNSDICCLCGRKNGDICEIPPTKSRVQKIKFKCKISFHIVPSTNKEVVVVKLCDQCHFEYHFF